MYASQKAPAGPGRHFTQIGLACCFSPILAETVEPTTAVNSLVMKARLNPVSGSLSVHF
jgi:hypothetical protein